MCRASLVLVCLLGLGACVIGSRVETESLPHQPRGALVTLRTRSQSVGAELLAVQDTALLVLTEQRRVLLVPYRAIRDSKVELLGVVLREGRPPGRGQQEQLRRLSRFPQGVGPELQRALLAAHDQTELDVIRP